MSNSQEQSLDENVVFLPVNEASAEFLHCEREREAVERLLIEGPEAFYSSTERSGCFLSPEEVSQISSWAQSFHFNPPQTQQENGVDGPYDEDDFCSTYFPCETDMPTPNLELGWPERDAWVLQGNITVHTNPPAEGEPAVREIIRRHLQRASQVIAIVTDRLTDNAIINDLHHVASQGVPIYIILNRRSIQENFTLNRLRHPNMRVRLLGGKSFCTRTGRMVVGEMKNKFLLVDLETVIHGSYSLTWTDAHLHRQLITVLTGPATEAFDREFRILYAASTPAPDKRSMTGSHASVLHQMNDFSDPGLHKTLSTEPEVINPPSPPSDCFLDWEAMGVVQRDSSGFSDSPLNRHQDIVVQEVQQQNAGMPVLDLFTIREEQFVEKNRIYENTSPLTSAAPDRFTSSKLTEFSSTEVEIPERMKRIEDRIKTAVIKQLSNENNNHLPEENPTRLDNDAAAPQHMFLSALRRERSRKSYALEGENSTDETGFALENSPSSRKPVILRSPHTESFSSLSDIMKKIQQRTSGIFKKGAMSERTQSMLDLSRYDQDTYEERRPPVPRFKGSFDPDPMTPALALMKKRNDNVKSALYGHSQNFMVRERPRSSSFALNTDWRKSLKERKAEQE
ncbi:unnamed protein product [Ophioblennius macclurei]